MIQELTGISYDAVYKTCYIDFRTGNDFDSFFSCQTGWGNIGLEKGKPYVRMASGHMDIKTCIISGEEFPVKEIRFFVTDNAGK